MMQMDSGGGPFPNDGLHQLFRHYRAFALTIAPYPNPSSTPPPIARLLTIRGYGPVGTEDAISGLTQPSIENAFTRLTGLINAHPVLNSIHSLFNQGFV